MPIRRVVSLILPIALITSAFAQQQKDPTALNLAAIALNTLTSGTNLSDVTLTGTVTETAGSTVVTGPATFKALGAAKSRMDFAASGRTEFRTLDA